MDTEFDIQIRLTAEYIADIINKNKFSPVIK